MSFMRNPLKIYIVSHNAKVFPELPHFEAIQGGSAIHYRLPISGDDTKDNISARNPFYAEITPMYWVWKNTRLPKYVGFFHYRRFFNFGPDQYPESVHWSEKSFHDFSEENIARFGWDKDTIYNSVHGSDIVTPVIETVLRPPEWREATSLYNHYDALHHIRDLELALEGIAKLYPEHSKVAEETIQRKEGYFCHMYIMRAEVFREYMEWLFSILFYVEQRVDLSSPLYLKEYGNQRIFGFLGERIFNVFVEISRRKGRNILEKQRLFGKLPEHYMVS